MIVLASSLIFFAVWGSVFTFGIFLKPLAEEFGWSRATTSGAFTLYMVIQGGLSILLGVLCDRYGPRLVLAGSTLIGALGYFLMFWLSSLWQFYLFFGVMAGIAGASYVVPFATIPRWMEKHRGLAIGIAFAGMGVGQTILAPVVTRIIQDYSWQQGFLFLAGVLFLLAFLPSFLFRRSPQPSPATSGAASAEGMTLGQALRSRPFWLLFVIWLFALLPIYIMLVHIVPHATDRGVTPEAAALIITIFGLVGIPSRLLLGGLSDRIGNAALYFPTMLAQTVAMFWLVIAGQLWAFYVIAALLSIGYSGIGVILLKIMPDFFGLKFLGVILAIAVLGGNIGAAVGPPLGGYIFDTTGGYSWAFLVGGLAFVLATILSLPLLSRLKGAKR